MRKEFPYGKDFPFKRQYAKKILLNGAIALRLAITSSPRRQLPIFAVASDGRTGPSATCLMPSARCHSEKRFSR